MRTLIMTQNMRNNFDYKLFEPYEVYRNEEYIQYYYDIKTVNTKLTIYDNNTVTIDGRKQNDIFNYLLDLCDEDNYVGCDEVGVGDFFGPVVYVSVKLDKESISKLKNLDINITDSKRIDNKKILDICNQLTKVIDYKYQVVYEYNMEGNLNSIGQKVYYHNLNQFKNTTPVIDLFTTQNSFYKYSNELNLSWNKDLILETKADSKFICVALASILARGIFLSEFYKLSKKYNKVNLKLGANVKKEAQQFCDVYSKEELKKICKFSFKTFDELK